MKIKLLLACIFVLGTASCKSNIFDAGETLGDTVIEIQFNLLDYLDPSQQVLAYGEDPQIPGDAGFTEITSPAKTLDIGDEIGEVKSIESVNIVLDYSVDNESGYADIKYIVYLSEIGQDPFSVPGIFSDEVQLSSNTQGTGRLVITADDRLKQLFQQKKFQYAAKLIVETGQGSENIKGTATINSFIADIVFTI